jgi:uncharacterized protein
MTDVYAALFDPFGSLARDLAGWLPDCQDGSHDLSHLARVWRFARQIQSEEGGDLQVLFAAAFLHDCVQVEKHDPLRPFASRWSARRAADALRGLDWPVARMDQVCHAISAHSQSAGITPITLEARIIQDADRLDSTGAIGIARCFYVAGRIGSELYHQSDPTARGRLADDMRNALDHFKLRLICECETFHSRKARNIARDRIAFVEQFLNQFLSEIREPGLSEEFRPQPWAFAPEFNLKNTAKRQT